MKHFIVFCFFFFLCFNIADAQTNANIAGPENVLVVYNANSDTSLMVANYYRNARNIPSINVVDLYLPDTTITIDNVTHPIIIAQETDIIRDSINHEIGAVNPSFHAWRYFLDYIASPIKQHLVNNNLINTIRYIVLCKGVPFKIQAAGDYVLAGTSIGNVTVGGLLCMLNTDNYESFIENSVFRSSKQNPYYNVDPNFTMNFRFLPDHFSNPSGFKLSYLVSHLDGISYEVVKGIIDRSIDPDMSGTAFWVLDDDPDWGGGNFLNTKEIMEEFEFNVLYDDTHRWITTHSGNVMGYSSWGTHAEDGNCSWEDSAWVKDSLRFSLSNGSVFNTYESFNGNSLTTLVWRYVPNIPPACHHTQGLATQFTEIGGTGTMGHAWEPGGGGVVQNNIFFPAYALGYNLIDAIYQGILKLAHQNVIVGDPLIRINDYNIDTLVGNIVWNSFNFNSGKIFIPAGSSLTINSNAEVVLSRNAALEVEGDFYIEENASLTLKGFSRVIAQSLTVYPNTEITLNGKSSLLIPEGGKFTMRENSKLNLDNSALISINGSAIIGNDCIINLSGSSKLSSYNNIIIYEGVVFEFFDSPTINMLNKVRLIGTLNKNIFFNHYTSGHNGLNFNCDSLMIDYVTFNNIGALIKLKNNLSNGLISVTSSILKNTSFGLKIQAGGITDYNIKIQNNLFESIKDVNIELINIPKAILDNNIIISAQTGSISQAKGISVKYCGDVQILNSAINIYGYGASSIEITFPPVDEEIIDASYQADISITNLTMNGNSFTEHGILISDSPNRIDKLSITECNIVGFINGISVINFENFTPEVLFNDISDYKNYGINLTNGKNAILRYNSISIADNSFPNNLLIGIYTSQVENPIILDNSITGTNISYPGPAIFSLSSNGEIRRNILMGHSNGIEFGGSAVSLAENRITGNKEFGLYIGATSTIDLSLTTIDEEGYPLTGYNRIFENGDCDPALNSEIYLLGSHLLLQKGCNTIADDRDVILNCDFTLLIDGERVENIIIANENYWGDHPQFGNDPTGRFGEEIQIEYDNYLPYPCEISESGNFIFLSYPGGNTIDTVYSTGVISEPLSGIKQYYANADKEYYLGNYSSAKQGYRQIVDSYGYTRGSLTAYSKLFKLEKLLESSPEYLSDLRTLYTSKLSDLTDSVMIGVLEHLINLCLVTEGQYLTAIANFESVSNYYPDTDLAFYSELNALTTALLLDSAQTLGKIPAKYTLSGVGDYLDRVNQLFKKKKGKLIYDGANILPVEFNLYQNFPNPFNPSTTIRYDIPRQSVVDVTVFDILGRKLRVLVNNEMKQAGRYEISFNAGNLPSGVYFYRITAGEYVSTKKMMLIK